VSSKNGHSNGGTFIQSPGTQVSLLGIAAPKPAPTDRWCPAKPRWKSDAVLWNRRFHFSSRKVIGAVDPSAVSEFTGDCSWGVKHPRRSCLLPPIVMCLRRRCSVAGGGSGCPRRAPRSLISTRTKERLCSRHRSSHSWSHVYREVNALTR
jgi:hypothetical protein